MKDKILFKVFIMNLLLTSHVFAMSFPEDKLVVIEGDRVKNCVNLGGKAVNTKPIPGQQNILVEKANGRIISRSRFTFQCKLGKHLGVPQEYSALIKSYYTDANKENNSKLVADIRKKIVRAQNKVTHKCRLSKNGGSPTCTDEETGEVKTATNNPNSISNITRKISNRLGETEPPDAAIIPPGQENLKIIEKTGKVKAQLREGF